MQRLFAPKRNQFANVSGYITLHLGTMRKNFRKYFLKNLLIGLGLGIIVVGFRYYRGYETTIYFAFGFILFIMIASFFIGLIDYYFYEKTAPRRIIELLNKSPLIDFHSKGFSIQDADKMVGQIRNYKIVLAPLTNIQKENTLTILIPIQLKNGLDEYFKELDNNFKLKHSGGVLFAEAIIKNYDKTYDYNKLLEILIQVTSNLESKNIESINIIDE